MKTNDAISQRLNPQTSVTGLESAFAALDSNRATGYASLGRARSAKSASLVREQKLLAVKYGTDGTPRIQQAGTALKRNETLRREVAALGEVLESPAPAVDAHTFVVYGFVRRRNQAGVPGLTLALTDAQGNWLKKGGYACTDRRGYFELRIGRTASDQPSEPAPPPKSEAELKKEAAAQAKVEKQLKAEAAKAAEAGAEAPKGSLEATASGIRINTNQDAANRAAVQLRVFNRDGRVLHVEGRPVIPTLGTVDYRLIYLGDEECGCTPPPEKSEGKAETPAPRAPVAPPAAPVRPASGSVEPRVAMLKSYDAPAAPAADRPPPATDSGMVGVPLEAIRGIGPKKAGKLRAAGVADVAEFKKTEGAAFVKIAGYDKTPPTVATAKPAADKAAKERTSAAAKAVEKKAAETKAAEAKAAARKPATTKTATTAKPRKTAKTTATARTTAQARKSPK